MFAAPIPTLTLPDANTDEKLHAAVLLSSIASIRQQQLPTGEIPSYRRAARGTLEYCRSLFVSTFVHDTLGHFDPWSLWYDAQTLGCLAEPYAAWFVREVVSVRRRIRQFLAWQMEADGTWRFFGRGSGIDPDSDTTACAAAVLLDGKLASSQSRWQRNVDALLRFRSAEGLFFSYVHPDRTGYTWMDERGGPILGFDRVVNANVLRYLGLAGVAADEVWAFLLDEGLGSQFEVGSPDYPNPLCFFYMLARTWRQMRQPDRAQLARHLTPHLLPLQNQDGDFGGPLRTALAMSALLDLDYKGPALERARASLLQRLEPWGGWGYEDFVIQGFGSPAWTTALALTIIDRCNSFG